MTASFPEATLFNSEVLSLSSSIANQDYQISIGFPPTYQDSIERYPVLYLLDSNVIFGAAVELARLLMWGEHLPEFIIVGIGYQIQHYKDWGRRRDLDMTPTKLEDNPGTGGAAEFLGFLETELIPYIDTNYRTNPADRGIIGHSSGGFFVLYALLHSPDLFQRYCAGSPDDYQEYYEYEKELAKNRTNLPARLTVVVGRPEERVLGATKSLFATLTDRKYKGLKLSLLEIDAESHFSVVSSVISLGLRSIYS